MNIKIVYNRKKVLNKNGEALIQIEVYFNAKRKYISTDIYVKPEHFDTKQNKVKKHNLAVLYNNKIAKLVSEINEKYLRNEKDFSFDLLNDENKPETFFKSTGSPTLHIQ